MTSRFTAPLVEKLRLHEQAFLDQDDAAIADHFFAADAIWIFQPFPSLRGRAEIGAFFAKAVTQSTVVAKLKDAGGCEDARWTLVAYHITPRDPAVAPWGYDTLFNWSRYNGDWLVDIAMGSPMPGSPMPAG